MPEQFKTTELYSQDLQEDAKRSPGDLLAGHSQLASYEGGWGFFEEHSVVPSEFQLTQNDDLLIDTILDEQPRPAVDYGPLSSERRAVAQDGVRRLFEAGWGFDNGTLEDVREARLRLHQLDSPKLSATKNWLYQKGRYIRYQDGPLEANRYEAFVNGSGSDFLHFGVAETPANTSDYDRLDTFMRVYIYAKPEYAGHIAAEIVRRMRDQYGKEIYGKISDISTDDSANALQREDNLLLYPRTHSEMVAAAQVLKELTAERPQVFNVDAGKLDRARKTDIPFVSIAEEPIQAIGGIQESFNSSRENIESEAQGLLVKKFLEHNSGLPYMSFKETFQYAYKNGLKSKKELKDVYRQAVQYLAPKYHVSQSNYSLNEGHDTDS